MSRNLPKKTPDISEPSASRFLQLGNSVIGLILVVCPLLFFTNLTRNPYYTQIALLNVAISVCVAFYLWHCWQRKEIELPRFPFEWPLLAFLIVAFISTILSWFRHSVVRPGIVNEGVRVWIFTLINSAVVVYLPRLFANRSQAVAKSPSLWNDLVFGLIWGMLWLGFHEMRNPAGGAIWDPYGAFLWMVGAAYAVVRAKSGKLIALFHIVFTVAVLAGVYGILQYWGRDMIWASPIQPYGGRPVSTFGNPNFLSSYLMMVSPVAMAIGLKATPRERVAYWLVAGVTALGVLCTLTRSTYLGLLASYLVLGVLIFRMDPVSSIKRVGVVVLLIIGFILIFPHSPVSSVQSPFTRFSEIYAAYKTGASYGPWDQRILIWSSAWEMLKGSLMFGKGWGCFELFYPFFQGHFILVDRLAQWRTHANNAHNVLLEIWSQAGFLGVGATLWLLVTIVYAGWKVHQRDRIEDKGFVSAGLLASVVGMVVDNFFGNVSLFFAKPAFLFWWFTGTLFVDHKNFKSVELKWDGLKPFAAVLLLLTLSVGTSIYFFKRWKQEVYYFQGFKEAKANAVLPSIKSLEKAVQWFPHEVNTNYELGNSYSRYARELAEKGLADESTKYNEKAASMYQAAIDANPGYDEIYFNLGVIQNQLGKTQEAQRNLEMCLFINPLFHDAYGSLGNYYINGGNVDKAINVLERGVSVFPKDKDLWNNLGYSYGQIDQDEKSFEAYKKAIYIDPGFKQAWHNLGVAATALKRHDPLLDVPGYIQDMETALAQKNYQKALEPAKKIVLALPENPDSHLSLGNIYFYLGQQTECEKRYLKAIELNSRFTVAYTNLGRLYQLQKKTAEAQNVFQKALEIDPNYSEARQALSELKR